MNQTIFGGDFICSNLICSIFPFTTVLINIEGRRCLNERQGVKVIANISDSVLSCFSLILFWSRKTRPRKDLADGDKIRFSKVLRDNKTGNVAFGKKFYK